MGKEIFPMEYRGLRILTTSQLADSFETDSQLLINNFNRNKDRYTEGKHFIALRDREKRDFIDRHQIDLGSKNAAVLYLWPKKGAWMHAKSLNTDKAWESYEALIDDYYEKIERALPPPSSIEDLIILQAQSMKDVKEKVALLEVQAIESKETMTTIKETLLHRDENWRIWVKEMINSAANRLGGGKERFQELRSKSYQLLTDRAGCKLDIRLSGLKKRLYEAGAGKTKINDANKLDVIEEDRKLKEIYSAIVKELSIGSL